MDPTASTALVPLSLSDRAAALTDELHRVLHNMEQAGVDVTAAFQDVLRDLVGLNEAALEADQKQQRTDRMLARSRAFLTTVRKEARELQQAMCMTPT